VLQTENAAHLIPLAGPRPDPGPLYRAVQRIPAETIGWRLFTILRHVEADQAVERLHSSDVEAYPVGGRKPLAKIGASHAALEKGEAVLAATKEDVQRAFFDPELIFSLGITAILNVPIRHAVQHLGILMLCGEEGMYGAADIARAKVLAGLLVPVLAVG